MLPVSGVPIFAPLPILTLDPRLGVRSWTARGTSVLRVECPGWGGCSGVKNDCTGHFSLEEILQGQMYWDCLCLGGGANVPYFRSSF